MIDATTFMLLTSVKRRVISTLRIGSPFRGFFIDPGEVIPLQGRHLFIPGMERTVYPQDVFFGLACSVISSLRIQLTMLEPERPRKSKTCTNPGKQNNNYLEELRNG